MRKMSLFLSKKLICHSENQNEMPCFSLFGHLSGYFPLPNDPSIFTHLRKCQAGPRSPCPLSGSPRQRGAGHTPPRARAASEGSAPARPVRTSAPRDDGLPEPQTQTRALPVLPRFPQPLVCGGNAPAAPGPGARPLLSWHQLVLACNAPCGSARHF